VDVDVDVDVDMGSGEITARAAQATIPRLEAVLASVAGFLSLEY
jgi:hypothetical protein